MRKLHEGIVIQVVGGRAKVKLARHSDCENCGSCPGNAAIVYDLPLVPDVGVGDKVALYIPERNMLRAAFVMFTMPMLLTFAMIVAGIIVAGLISADAYIFGSVFGAIGIVAGFSYVHRFEKKHSSSPGIYIDKIVKKYRTDNQVVKGC